MGRRSVSTSGDGGGQGGGGEAKGSVSDPSADAALAKMGYASELPRNLSMLSVLGM